MFTKEELIEIRNLIDGSKDKLTDETNRIRNSIASKIFSKLHGCPQEGPVSEELEEEIERYLKESLAVKFPTTNIGSIKADIRYIARHFANWQKQQMMKDAVDGEVTYGKSLAIPSLGYRLDKEGLDFGDKVKLIIIKED